MCTGLPAWLTDDPRGDAQYMSGIVQALAQWLSNGWTCAHNLSADMQSILVIAFNTGNVCALRGAVEGPQRGGMICCLLDLGSGAGSSNSSLGCDNSSRGDRGSSDHSHGSSRSSNSSGGPRNCRGFPVLQAQYQGTQSTFIPAACDQQDMGLLTPYHCQ